VSEVAFKISLCIIIIIKIKALEALPWY